MPVKVLKKIVRIQREFIWGGVEGGRKINWVKWSSVCQPKEHGGLGVKDVRLMNLSLLAKWRWRLVNEENALWKEMLVERYGRGVSTKLEGGEAICPSSASKWWKDVVNLDKRGKEGWFNDVLDRQVGDGTSTSFWRMAWRGAIPFMAKYNRLFTISNQQDASVAEMWEEHVNGGSWRFTWRRCLFVWEEALFANLLADLEGFVFTGVEDKWNWNLEDAKVYSVKSLYDKLEEDGRVEGIHTEMEKYVFGNIWKAGVPSKVTAFVWKALSDRIPTRLNLEIRHCLPPDIGTNCVWCGVGVETTSHIFLHCDLVRNVWMKLMEWLDFNFIMPPNLFIHWECWSGGVWNNRIRKGLRMIWQAAIWVMWKARNNCIFNNEITRWEEVVDEIKVVSWRWLLGRFQGPSCLFYEWEWDPQKCLLR